MNKEQLISEIRRKRSFLCVGLDPDLAKIPSFLVEGEEDPIYEFNKQIVDATAAFCVAYKPNTAFYEACGISGLNSLERTIRYIRANYPEQFIIADAKRGDIGNTSTMYAKAFFKRFGADAVTVAPFMGEDSVKPFLAFEGKWAIVLGLTSNDGAADFQQLLVEGRPLYKHVIEKCAAWGNENNLMFVVGATKPAMLAEIRKMLPKHFFLVPGVGAQGGSLDDVCKAGLNDEVGLLVNASRSILYASSGKDFAENAGREAQAISAHMGKLMK